MKLGSKNVISALEALDQELEILDEHRELIACGGGVLSVMGVIARETRDLDVIIPSIDSVLLECSHKVASRLGLDKGWLNNGPSGFVKDLDRGFELRAEVVFKGPFLTLKALGRRDLIATKLQGMCDRDEHDLEDLLHLKPSASEVESLKKWLLDRDASAYWPSRVELADFTQTDPPLFMN